MDAAQRAGVAAQIAFALPLLVGASLLIRSAINVMRVDLGFASERMTTLRLEVSRVRHPSDADVAAYYTRLLAEAVEQSNSGPLFAASLISEVFAYPDYSTLIIEHRIPGFVG